MLASTSSLRKALLLLRASARADWVRTELTRALFLLSAVTSPSTTTSSTSPPPSMSSPPSTPLLDSLPSTPCSPWVAGVRGMEVSSSSPFDRCAELTRFCLFLFPVDVSAGEMQKWFDSNVSSRAVPILAPLELTRTILPFSTTTSRAKSPPPPTSSSSTPSRSTSSRRPRRLASSPAPSFSAPSPTL